MMQTATYSRRQNDDVVYLGGPQFQSHRGVISSGGTLQSGRGYAAHVPESRNVRIAARNVLIWFQLGSPWDASHRQ